MIISEKAKKELDSLINIAKTYRDNVISYSTFLDVVSTLKSTRDEVLNLQEYVFSQGVSLSGIEVEDDNDDNSDATIDPYDPSKIDIALKTMSLSLLIDRLSADEFDLMPDFQRKAGLWTKQQKSQLIESLILRIPLPAFYFDGSSNDRWIVIDGLQRLTALKDFFVTKELKLQGLEFLKDLEDIGIDELPRAYIRRMNETQIISYIINPGAPVNLKYNIFKRINTGGLQLEPQEIRHALYQGNATKFISKIATLNDFTIATSYSVSTERMLDREFVIRFIAFRELGVDKYMGSIEIFLNNAMDYLNKCDSKHFAVLENAFTGSLDLAYKLFGKFAFRKMFDKERRRPISKALFETWTCLLSKLTADEQVLLLNKKKILISNYIEMTNTDDEFLQSLNSGKISSARKRFEKIDTLLKEVLKND